MRFEIGQKVICINNVGAKELNKDDTYTIKEVVPSFMEIALTLNEVQIPEPYIGYRPNRFAPLEEWQQAEEAVEELLNTELVEL